VAQRAALAGDQRPIVGSLLLAPLRWNECVVPVPPDRLLLADAEYLAGPWVDQRHGFVGIENQDENARDVEVLLGSVAFTLQSLFGRDARRHVRDDADDTAP